MRKWLAVLLTYTLVMLPVLTLADDTVPPSSGGGGGAPSGPAGGSLGGTYPNPHVDHIDEDGDGNPEVSADGTNVFMDPDSDGGAPDITFGADPTTATMQWSFVIDSCAVRTACTMAELQTAIDAACNPTGDTKGTILWMPLHDITNSGTSGVNIGTGGTCYGLHLRGYGGGNAAANGPSGIRQTGVLSAGEAVIEIIGLDGGSIRDISIEGVAAVSGFVGIEGDPNTATSSVLSHVLIEHVSIRNPNSTSSPTSGAGDGIVIAGGVSDQADHVTIRNVEMVWLNRCLHANGVQVTNLRMSATSCREYETDGVFLEQGYASVDALSISTISSAPTGAGFRVAETFGELQVDSLYTETGAGTAVLLDSGAHEGARIFDGTRIAMKYDSVTAGVLARHTNGYCFDADGAHSTLVSFSGMIQTDSAGRQCNVRFNPGDNTIDVSWDVAPKDSTGTEDPDVIVYYAGRNTRVVSNPWGILGDAATETTMALMADPGRLHIGPPVAASRVYVASTGNDSNTGGYFDPFLTIEKAKDEVNGIGCGWHVIIQDDLTSGTDDALSFDGIQAEGDYFGEYCGLIEGPDQNTMVTINPTSAGGATTGGGVIKADVTSATPGLVIVRNIIFGANWTSEDLLDCANDGMLLAVNVDTSVPTIVGSGDNAITSHNNCKLGVIGYRGATKTTATGAMIAVTGASDAFVFDPTAWLQHNFDSAGVDAVNITAGSGELTLVGGTITSNGTTNSVQGIELAGGNSTTPTLRAARVMVGNLAGSGSEALRIMPDGTSEVASYIGYGNSWTSGAFNTQDGLAGPVAPGAGSNVNIFEVGSAYQLNTGPLLDFVAGYDCTGSDTLNITYAAYDEDPGTVLYNWNGTTSATQSTPTGCTALFETGSQEMGGAGTEGRPFRVNSPLYQLQAGNPAAGALTPNYHSIDPPPGNLKIPFQVEHLFPGYSLGQLALDNERAGAK